MFRRWRNVRYARAAVRHSLKIGEYPIASHLLYTQRGILRDRVPGERHLGIEAGLAWARPARLAAFYVDHPMSEGMAFAFLRHETEGRAVEYRTLSGAPGKAGWCPEEGCRHARCAHGGDWYCRACKKVCVTARDLAQDLLARAR